MKTILHVGKPREGGNWLALAPEFVSSVRDIGYETRELVTRDDAEQAVQAERHAAIDQVLQLLEREFRTVASPAMIRRVRALKVKP